MRTHTRVHANHTKNDAQKGCAMQLDGITLNARPLNLSATTVHICTLNRQGTLKNPSLSE